MMKTALNAAAHYPTDEIAIVGGGLVGRLLAWQLAQANHNVSLYEAGSKAGEGAAAYAAAAMLTPLAEATAAEPQVIDMGQASLPMWQHIISQLAQPVFYQQAGSLLVWHPQDGAEASLFYRRLQRCLSPEALATQVLSQNHAQITALEPALAPRFKEGLYLSGEGQLDNRQVLDALLDDLHQRPNVRLFWQHACEPEALSAQAQWVIDCRGFGAKKRWNRPVPTAAQGSTLRGIRGEVVRLFAPEVSLNRPVRLLHPRYPIYCAPKQNGLFVVGATEIESEDLSPVSVRSALELLSAVHTLHPAFAEARVLEMRSHCRPTLSHHLPEIRHGRGNIIDVNGLYRHGFLIAPVVVAAATELIQTRLTQGLTPDWAQSQPRPYLFTWMEDDHEHIP